MLSTLTHSESGRSTSYTCYHCAVSNQSLSQDTGGTISRAIRVVPCTTETDRLSQRKVDSCDKPETHPGEIDRAANLTHPTSERVDKQSVHPINSREKGRSECENLMSDDGPDLGDNYVGNQEMQRGLTAVLVSGVLD